MDPESDTFRSRFPAVEVIIIAVRTCPVFEGLWTATKAAVRAFKDEMSKPKSLAFENEVSNIATATDVLFAVDRFYKVIKPTVDASTAKTLEGRLETAVRKVGYRMHPKDIMVMSQKAV